KPGNPQQNGRHERMHRTLKKETTRPAGKNLLQQQGKFDFFVQEYNFERPHEALGMKCPAEVYKSSPRVYKGLPDVEYPMYTAPKFWVEKYNRRLCSHDFTTLT